MLNRLVYNKDAIIEVTKEVSFDSAHYLNEYAGKCSKLHGHLFKLFITVSGTCNDIGLVLDFKDLKTIVKEEILDKFDHECINELISFNPTAENMVCYIFDVLSKYFIENSDWGRLKLIEVKLYETPTSYAVYKGVNI